MKQLFLKKKLISSTTESNKNVVWYNPKEKKLKEFINGKWESLGGLTFLDIMMGKIFRPVLTIEKPLTSKLKQILCSPFIDGKAIVTNITPAEAYSGCTSITSADVLNSVDHIETDCFKGCTNLSDINFLGNPAYIYDGAFAECTSLKSINIPESVIEIGKEAFRGCSSLTSIKLPDLGSIADYAFANCTNLSSIQLPNYIDVIASYAFKGCSNLTSITLPVSLEYLLKGAFASCSKLKTVYIHSNNLTTIEPETFLYCSLLESMNIPESVTSIKDSAFKGCSGLRYVQLSTNLTSIGGDAFYNCKSLKSIKLPNTLTSLGLNAFYGCSSLEKIVLPNKLTSIPMNAFWSCILLDTIDIGENVTSIGTNAFRSATPSLIICRATTPPSAYLAFSYYDSLVAVPKDSIAAYKVATGWNSFTDYIALEDIEEEFLIIYTATSKLSIDESSFLNPVTSHTFNNGTGVISFADKVTYSGACSFENNLELTSIILPKNVEWLGMFCFSGCTNLQSITCKATTPPYSEPGGLDNLSTSIPIYVPRGCVNAYKAHSDWKKFTNILEIG